MISLVSDKKNYFIILTSYTYIHSRNQDVIQRDFDCSLVILRVAELSLASFLGPLFLDAWILSFSEDVKFLDRQVKNLLAMSGINFEKL
jgi:hypothetical protein